jgi:hypothetical protein
MPKGWITGLLGIIGSFSFVVGGSVAFGTAAGGLTATGRVVRGGAGVLQPIFVRIKDSTPSNTILVTMKSSPVVVLLANRMPPVYG